MSDIINELIGGLDDAYDWICELLPAESNGGDRLDNLRYLLAKARALQVEEPHTVLGWLELAREAELPWAESAIEQCANPSDLCPNLCEAVWTFGEWTKTKEGRNGGTYWQNIALGAPSYQDLVMSILLKKEGER